MPQEPMLWLQNIMFTNFQNAQNEKRTHKSPEKITLMLGNA